MMSKVPRLCSRRSHITPVSLSLLILLQLLGCPYGFMPRIHEPRRPDEFRSIAELKQYLKELHKYYSVVGRPRFGRSVDTQFNDLDKPSFLLYMQHLLTGKLSSRRFKDGFRRVEREYGEEILEEF